MLPKKPLNSWPQKKSLNENPLHRSFTTYNCISHENDGWVDIKEYIRSGMNLSRVAPIEEKIVQPCEKKTNRSLSKKSWSNES